MKNNYFLKFKLIIEYFLVYFIYLILSTLPIIIVSNMGGAIFKLFGPFTKKQKIVKKNLIQIFPKASKAQIEKNTKESWISTGKTFFELLILPKIINKKNKIIIEGQNFLNEIIKKKEQAIFVSIHQSNWEILLPSIDKLGIPVGGIYRHINNPYINNLILKIRKKSIFSKQSFYTPKGKKSAKEIIEGLKKKISIVLLIDQKDSAGDIVNLFNFPSKTQTGFLKLAKKHKLKIIPIENIRNKNNTFTLKFHEPIKNLDNNLPEVENMKRLHSIIELWIKKNPSSWFLQHNRFN